MFKIKFRYFILLLLVFFGVMLSAYPVNKLFNFLEEEKKVIPKIDFEKQKEDEWVNSKFDSLSEDERIGQLFMIPFYPNLGAQDEMNVKDLILKYHVGGLIVFQGGPHRTAALLNQYQELSKKVPLMVSVDGEWGLNMRMDSVIAFPRQLLMGAIQDNKIIYEFGKEVAKQCKRVGIHINFAPVVDVNNNAANPVIGDRSFGENKENVTAKAQRYMLGMQENGVMACAKHFPGHGDTDVDSHYDLPVLQHSFKRLDSIELFPFKNLIRQGIKSIMVAHLHIPSIDSSKNIPTTLSKPAVYDLLISKMNFEGLIFTDAMNMKGVSNHFTNGDAELKALIAGVDVLLMPGNIPIALKKIKDALKNGQLSKNDIDNRVKKILRAKYRLGLAEYKPTPLGNISSDLNNHEAHVIYEKLIENSITLTENPDQLIPIQKIKDRKIASFSIGNGYKSVFQSELDKYGIQTHYQSGSIIVGANYNRLLTELKKQEIVLIGLNRVGRYIQTDYDITPSARQFINELSKSVKVVLCVFGSPYSLKFFEQVPSVICTYVNDDAAERKAAQAVLGGIPIIGRLPVTASGKFRFGTGVSTSAIRLGYAEHPEDLGFDSKILDKIDLVVNEGISKGAMPGCQVLVVKDSKIAFHRTYGHFTYEKQRKVQPNDVYDLASITKVAATTLSVMKLYDEGLLDINKTLGFYMPELQGSNIENLNIREVLLHQSGLKAWLPFYQYTLDEAKKPNPAHYRTKADEEYCYRVFENLYICKSKQDTFIWNKIIEKELDAVKTYKYSDVGFLLLGRLVEKISNKTLDRYVSENYYQPMGLENIGFNPLSMGISKNRTPPTEEDKYYRYKMVQGDVHDMGAAMLGGVAGHAGLFAQAIDLAAVFQMLLNKGSYNNKNYLSPQTVEDFIKRGSEISRRALGFDTKEATEGQISKNVAWQASDATYGHTGFTGTSVWVDPKQNLVYIFLSNRSYPSGENMKVVSMNIRTRIQEHIYDAMVKKG